MEKILNIYKDACPADNTDPLSEDVLFIDMQLKSESNNGELWMKRGLALAKQKKMQESVEAFSRAIASDRFNSLYYRHRGHRLLSRWEISNAIADFSIGAELDPDNWDILYHLGLAYFLVGSYENAKKAYCRCLELTVSDVKRVAIVNWYWITLMKLGKCDEANIMLNENIKHGMEVDYNIPYYNLTLMYKGDVSPKELLAIDDMKDVEKITMAYGIAGYYYLSGNIDKGNKVINMILDYKEMSLHYAFAYIAALIERVNRT